MINFKYPPVIAPVSYDETVTDIKGRFIQTDIIIDITLTFAGCR